MFDLPDIDFTDKNAEDIESSIITLYEALTGRTLAAGDPVRLFLEAVAAIIVQQRILIDYAAKQNLLAYAEDEFLDHIGVLVGATRLAASAATTTIRFTLSAPQSEVVIIPDGIRVATASGVIFEVTEAGQIPIGELTVDVPAECTETGVDGNGFLPGQIKKLVDPIQWVQSAVNITESTGGADTEDDDNYRTRIRQAPESFSVAGPTGAYEYWAKTASQDIIDVAVYSPEPGTVEIRPLLDGGELPGEELLASVLETCNSSTVRPLTDKVVVLAPEVVNYNIVATYYIDSQDAAISAAIQQEVIAAVNDYVEWQKSKLGRDINPSELIRQVMEAGTKRIVVNEPVYAVLESYQVAIAGTVTLTFGGLEDG
ncbi:hypothetical protein SCACP_21260 [Sporomusa carbonis]|uniref:baseplate assembly protein n=1 Tax=Sporomusa carbonis TaxID=3076075 RepID=UPI003A601E39